MALTCRKMAVCQPDLVSIQRRLQDAHENCEHFFSIIAVLLLLSSYIMYLWTYGLNLLYCVFILLPLIACFCSSGLLSCSQIRWGDLSKCCRVLQLWECHLISRAHCVTSCCVLEEAWVSVYSLNSIDCQLQNLNRFQSHVPQPVAPLFFPPCFPPHAPPAARIGSVKTDACLFSKPQKLERSYLDGVLSPFCSFSLQIRKKRLP